MAVKAHRYILATQGAVQPAESRKSNRPKRWKE